MELKALTPKDVDSMFEIEKKAYFDPWTRGLLEQSIGAPMTHTLGAFENDGLWGYSIYQVIFNEAHLLNLAVDPVHQKRGIGKKMLEAILSDCKQKGAESMFLEVRPTNEAARALYEKRGFKVLMVRERYYSNGESALVMNLDLYEPSEGTKS